MIFGLLCFPTTKWYIYMVTVYSQQMLCDQKKFGKQ